MCSEKKKLLHQIYIGEVTSKLLRKPVYDDINMHPSSIIFFFTITFVPPSQGGGNLFRYYIYPQSAAV